MSLVITNLKGSHQYSGNYGKSQKSKVEILQRKITIFFSIKKKVEFLILFF